MLAAPRMGRINMRNKKRARPRLRARLSSKTDSVRHRHVGLPMGSTLGSADTFKMVADQRKMALACSTSQCR